MPDTVIDFDCLFMMFRCSQTVLSRERESWAGVAGKLGRFYYGVLRVDYNIYHNIVRLLSTTSLTLTLHVV